MNVQDFYRQLLAVLSDNEKAAVVSVYDKGKKSASKEIIACSNTKDWQRIEELLGQSDAKQIGPVSHICQANSLTVIERYIAKPRLVILGGGHIAAALVQMAALLDFDILVYDDRPSFASVQRFPLASTIICDSFERLFERVPIRSTDFVVVVTRGHKHDSACLHGILAGIEPIYTGMIGSRRRVAIVMEQMRQAAHDEARIKRVHSPIGLRIGGVTPAEIAISILAEIISVRRSAEVVNSLSSCDIEIAEALASEKGSHMQALITIFDTTGSVPIDCGAKLAMSYEGQILGTIGGGCSEADAMQAAREAIRTQTWQTHTVDMSESAEDDGMVCGGKMQVVIEVINGNVVAA